MKAPAQCSDLTDLITSRSNGGEIHQHAAGGAERLTTAQGVIVANIQNSLRIGSPAP